jgi:hypothetical protein
MLRVGGLEARYMLTEFRLMEPVRNEAAQTALPFRRMVVAIAVKRMAGEG